MTEQRMIKVVVDTQGGIRASEPPQALVWKSGQDVMVVCIDLATKRGEVLWTGGGDDGCLVAVEPTEDSVHVDPAMQDKETVFRFPSYGEWTILMAQVSKYTLYITFVKP